MLRELRPQDAERVAELFTTSFGDARPIDAEEIRSWLRNEELKPDWLRVLEGYAGPQWTAREVTLFVSHLGEGRGGRPRHEPVAVLPLGAAEDG